MLHARLPRLALLAVVCCLMPTAGSAQIGGFLKNKVKPKVKGDWQPLSTQAKTRFTPAELKALPPRCGTLLPAIQKDRPSGT